MFAQTISLPPLKGNNPRTSDSFVAASIRSELTKIQQSLQRYNQIYNDYLLDIPHDILESIQSVQESQNLISKEIQKDKLEKIKKKITKYNSTIDFLSSSMQNHINLARRNDQIDFFAEIFPSFKDSLISQNQAVLDSFEKNILEKVSAYEQAAKGSSDTSSYKLKSPFSNSPKQQKPEMNKSTMQSFTTLSTVLDIEKHNQRLQSLENKLQVALDLQNEALILSEKDMSQQIYENVIENHEKIKKLVIKSRVISKKIEHPIPLIADKPQIKLKKKSNVEQYSFDQFSASINKLNEKILAQVESYEKFAEQKIISFNQCVDTVESKILDFEKSVINLNELVASINQKIERAEESRDEIETSMASNHTKNSDFSKLIESFKFKLSSIQSEARNEIEQLKLQLNILEADFLQ